MFSSEFELARSLFDQGKIKEGWEVYDSLLKANPSMAVEILRERAHAYARVGMLKEALADRESILSTTTAAIGDFYFAGEHCVELGQYDKAKLHFDRVITLSLAQSSEFYLKESRLLKAFCHIRLKEKRQAMRELDVVSDGFEMLWVAGEEKISKSALEEILKHL